MGTVLFVVGLVLLILSALIFWTVIAATGDFFEPHALAVFGAVLILISGRPELDRL